MNAISLYGTVGISLDANAPKLKHNIQNGTLGTFSSKHNIISITPDGIHVFPHEWMHALEKFAKNFKHKGTKDLWSQFKKARRSLRTMDQDTLNTRGFANHQIKRFNVDKEISREMGYFLRSAQVQRQKKNMLKKAKYLGALSMTLSLKWPAFGILIKESAACPILCLKCLKKVSQQ